MITEIRKKIKAKQYEFSKHAIDQSIIRHISVQELCGAILNGEIIEDYPEDKYGPSCLILGFTPWRADHCMFSAVIPRVPR